MAIDLNMDIGDVIQALRKGGDKESFAMFAYGTNIAIVLAVFAALYTWHMFYYTPQQKNMAVLQEEYRLYEQKAKELPLMQANIKRMNTHIKENKHTYTETLGRFFEGKNIDMAYQHVSAIAKDTDMTVMAIRKGREVSKDAPLIAQDTFTHIDVTPVPVSLRLKGSYPDYLRFRKVLREGKPFYTVTADTLTLTKDPRYFGHIEADITLTAYTMKKDAIITALADY